MKGCMATFKQNTKLMFDTPFKNPAVFPMKRPPNDFYLAH